MCQVLEMLTDFMILNKYLITKNSLYTVQFSRSVMSDSLRPHESQHARPPCPTLTPRAYPNSCPLSQ